MDLDPLVLRHVGRVRNFVFRMLLCEATADDVTQEVFLQVFCNLHSFRGDSKFTTWLYQISLNVVRQHLRRLAKRETVELDPSTIQASNTAEPIAGAIGNELEQEIEQALSKLTTKMRTAIVLTMIEQLSPAEAAKVEGCSTATMHWRVHHARKQLKNHLRSYVKS